LGADEMRPHIEALSRVAETRVIAFPNAGLPNAFGEYDESPDDMTGQIEPWIKDGTVNVLPHNLSMSVNGPMSQALRGSRN